MNILETTISSETLDLLLFFSLIVLMLLSLFMQYVVYGSFNKYSATLSGALIGGEAARAMLHDNGIYDITFERARTHLGDHFNPRNKTIALSDNVLNQNSVAAIAIACHEAGHAIQYHNHGFLIKVRTALVPVAIFSNYFAWLILMIGLIVLMATNNYYLLIIGTALLGVMLIYSIITLPIEFDASKKAITYIKNSNLLRNPDDIQGAKKVLRAASFTYVLAFLISLVQFMRFLNIITNRRR